MPFVIEPMTRAPRSAETTRPTPAEQAGAADHGRRDDEQQQLAAARVRRDRAEPRGEHDPADAGHEAADHEDGDAHPVDVDPGAA